MLRKDVRPEILDAFSRYADTMTEESFCIRYNPTNEELEVLKRSGEFYIEEELGEYWHEKNEEPHEDLLTDEEWWRIFNDM